MVLKANIKQAMYCFAWVLGCYQTTIGRCEKDMAMAKWQADELKK